MAKKKAVPEPEIGSTEVPDYTKVPVLLKHTRIREVVARVKYLADLVQQSEKELKELRLEGATLFAKNKIKSVLMDGFKVTRLDGVSTRISGSELFKLGVSKKVIEKATKRSNWISLKVSVPGEKNGDDEENG